MPPSTGPTFAFRLIGFAADLLLYLLLIVPIAIDLTLGSTCSYRNEAGVSGCALGDLGDWIESEVVAYGVFFVYGGYTIILPVALAAATVSVAVKFSQYRAKLLSFGGLARSAPALVLFLMVFLFFDWTLLRMLLSVIVIPWFLVEWIMYRKAGVVSSPMRLALLMAAILILVIPLLAPMLG